VIAKRSRGEVVAGVEVAWNEGSTVVNARPRFSQLPLELRKSVRGSRGNSGAQIFRNPNTLKHTSVPAPNLEPGFPDKRGVVAQPFHVLLVVGTRKGSVGESVGVLYGGLGSE